MHSSSPAPSVESTIYDVGVCSPESYISSPSPNQPRQRLRPWLTDQINEGKTPGLEWVNKEQLMFKVPWKHFGRPGIDEINDAMLFRNWALHTKKWQEGQPSDISTWKTRFRCALTKLQDIVELSNLHQTEGDEPYRVYQFKKKADTQQTSQRMHRNYVDQIGVIPVFPGGNYQSNPAQFSEIDTSDFSPQDLELPCMDGIEDDLDKLMRSEANFNTVASASTNDVSGMPQQDNIMSEINSQQSLLTAIQTPIGQNLNSMTSLRVKLFYVGREIGEKVVDNQRGLRIAFNPPPPLPQDVVRQDSSEVVSHIYGPFHAEQIYFPPTHEKNILEVLEMTKRGLVLQARNGEIMATRLCRAKIFYSEVALPTAQPKELPREHTTVIFDYVNDFLPKFKLYVQGQGPLPSAERYFSFAQRCSSDLPLNNIYVYVSVTHILAQRQLDQIRKQQPDFLVSDPNMLDMIANQIEELSINNVGMQK